MTASEALLHSKAIKNEKIKNDKMVKPIPRGFIGHLFNRLGMFYTRLIIRLEGRGLENIPQKTPYILAANHETYVDGMLIASFLPRDHFKLFTSLAAQDLLTDHGIFGHIIMRVGRGIPLNRNGSPSRGLITAKYQVDAGNILLVHPEGTRTSDGRLGEIHNGASFLAKKADVPLIPVFIDGGYEVFNRYMKWPKGRDPKTGGRRKVIITFGKPLYPREFKKPQEMTAVLTDWMHEMFQNKEVPREFDDQPSAEA